MPPRVTVYSDYICPFCFIGKALVDRLERQFGIEAEWKGFEIHPEIPPGGCDLQSLGFSEGRTAALYSRITEMAGEVGISLDPSPRISNSRLALEVAEFAKDKDRFLEYHDAVFKAYWQEGVDIGSKEELFCIAAGAGLDTEELEAYLKNGRAETKLNEHLREVLQYSIDGVPTFIIGRKMVVGAQPYEVLEKAFKEELARDASGSE